VTDPSKRAALAALYHKSWEIYLTLVSATPHHTFGDPARNVTQTRIYASAQYLVDHLHEVPVHVIPCIVGRTEGQPIIMQSAQWGTIAPAAWSFMLAARARGLGTSWTSFHLLFEWEAAEILGIPYAEIMQACLIPVAYTKGTEFKPGPREPLQSIVHWETWCS
jgi:nitroreductase